MRYLTAGESHGKEMLVIIEGFPANVPMDRGKILAVLNRRRQTPGRSSRMQLESDSFLVTAGLRNGLTLGSPLAVTVSNAEWHKWAEVMDPWSCRDRDPITVPRPGHADLAGGVKYRLEDLRLVAERASARETVVRTVAGCFALQLLEHLGIGVSGQTVDIGDVEAAARAGDTVGGIIEVEIQGLPGGIGSYVHWDRRLDARLAAAVMGIQAVKGVEFGHAFTRVTGKGSSYHDEYAIQGGSVVRRTNNAGGVEGGMSNGQPVLLRAAIKPVPTLDRPLPSFDMKTRASSPAPVSRHDTSAVGAAAVVAEAVCAWEVAVCLTEQFGGENLEDLRQRFSDYRQRWEEAVSCPGQ